MQGLRQILNLKTKVIVKRDNDHSADSFEVSQNNLNSSVFHRNQEASQEERLNSRAADGALESF